MNFRQTFFNNSLLVMVIIMQVITFVDAIKDPSWGSLLTFFLSFGALGYVITIRPRGDRLREAVGSWWRRLDSM